jgi:RecT family
VVLLKNYLKIADASEIELKGCLEVARRYKIDPFKQGQIWFVKRWDKNAATTAGTKGAYVYTPQVGIYGMLHIAARDYKDYGSVSEPEFGPMFTHDVEGHKIKAPEWCRVKAFKKGIAEPTVATIYFEEFCPAVWDNARLFWAKMPRAQLEKCAKARVVRTAYPDLGGLYIPEEMDRINDEVTPGGRQIVQGDHREARSQEMTAEAKEAIESLKAKGLWCEEHHCTRSEAHLRVCESSRNSLAGAAKSKEGKPPGKSQPSSAPANPKKVPESEYRPENIPPATKTEPWKFSGTLTIDYTNNLRLTGDLDAVVTNLPAGMNLTWGNDSFYHVAPADLDKLKQVCVGVNYEIVEIKPTKSSPQRHDGEATAKGRSPKPSASESGTPAVVEGTIQRCNAGMAGKYPVRQVTLLLADTTKPTYSCFDKDLFEDLDKGLGKFASFVVKKNKSYLNIVGLRKIGSQEYDEDGKTKVIQNRDREAGGRTLF